MRDPAFARSGIIGITLLLTACGGGGGSNALPNVNLAQQGGASAQTPVPASGASPVPTSAGSSGGSSSGLITQPVATALPVTIAMTQGLGSGGAEIVTTPEPVISPPVQAGSPTAAPTVPPGPVFLPINVSFPIPAAYLPTQSIGRRTLSGSGFGGYASTAAPVSITLNVTPVGGSTSTYSGSCTVAANGLSGTCTVAFTALPGATSLSGTLGASGNTIATFSQLVIIDPASTNSFNFTANPAVKSVVLSLASGSVNAGSAADVLLAVNAYDADGDLIAGTAPYTDVNGNRISLRLSAVNVQKGGSGTVVLKGPPSISTPNGTAVYAHYNGAWLDHANISVTATSAAVTTLTGTTLSTTPKIYEYSGLTAAAKPEGIVAGPDGNLWATETNVDQILKMSTAGVVLAEYSSGITSGAYPHRIAKGPDGNIWFTEYHRACVARITPAGLVTEFTAGISGGAANVDIVTGPDGAMWFAESATNKIGHITMQGNVNEFNGGTNNPYGMALGPDGNIWFNEQNDTLVGRITQAGTINEFSYSAGGSTNQPGGGFTGPDGNYWFVENDGAHIGKVTPGGATMTYSAGISANPNIRWLTLGPDGNLWFTEQNNAKIASITTGGVVTEYNNGLAGSGPVGIATGPDGNIWFAEGSGNRIGKFVL